MPLLTRTSRRVQRGQSIVIALLVLLILGLVGALFVTIVARNLVNARRANRVVTADYYARAGITFADAQLTFSPDGADWRPPLQNAVTNPPTEAREAARYNNAVTAQALAATNANDPDKEYLDAGYARYNTGAGRFLLRLTYDPINLNAAPVAPGRYIKIESIGREGVIDPIDPTTYSNNRSSDRLQAYQVAYKPIGITDYARFETNPDKRSDPANLGVVSQYSDSVPIDGIFTPGVYDVQSQTGLPIPPLYRPYPIATTYGAADEFLEDRITHVITLNPLAGSGKVYSSSDPIPHPGGGSLHANMTVRFFGENVVYLNDAGATAPLYQDTVEIANDLLLDSYDPAIRLDNAKYLPSSGSRAANEGQRSSLVVNPPVSGAIPLTAYVSPSNDTGSNGGFDTFGGLIRDGSTQPDPEGLPRDISRLEPPVMDGTDPASALPRYKYLAMMSPPRVNPSAASPANFAPGSSAYGYGNFIYVDNTADVQPESQAIGGGSTLTDEWLSRTAPNTPVASSKGNWHGLLYSPPGVNITLGALVKDSGGTNLPGIHLTRSDGNWKNPDGTPGTSEVMDASYHDMTADNDPSTPAGNLAANADNDIVIYAEGNVRLRGILSPNENLTGTGAANYLPRHITIVTNATAYIDGNLLKGSPDSSITVLAHDYVCVNTTQFLTGAVLQSQLPPLIGNSFEIDDANSLVQDFNFGLTGAQTPLTQYGANTLALYVSGGPPPSGGSAQVDFDVLNAAGASVLGAALQPTFNAFTHITFDLSGNAGLTGALFSSPFQLSVKKDPGQENANTPNQNFSLERVAVLPMDIRVEAVLYAQTRSFFVIPGDWFNTSSNDTLDIFEPTVSAAYPTGTRPVNTDARFPFYGQPIDLKIIIDGAVSEARPADIAAQSAWMLKWGWIPQYHGSLIPPLSPATTPLAESAGHVVAGGNAPAAGLQIIYNPQAGYPYNPGNGYYLRSDVYGRPLPFSPKLPVSTGLLYSGESGEPPLLQ